MKTLRHKSLSALTILAAAASLALPAAAQFSLSDKLHAQAVESFRVGRFPEAYGRFISLAQAGHPASARYALWMCQHGLELFGKDWDCAPHEIADWARLAGVAGVAGGAAVTPPSSEPRHYAAGTGPRSTARR
ncbi:MAG: hypothetical protein H7Z19_18725 [Chitinophagaceae bacterium]|nr:hypothetical protein [Rubrivivax sp.]